MENPLRFHTDGMTHGDDGPLRQPVVVLAYAGWSNGGDAATEAARFLLESFQARPLATIDCEEFLDFTVQRPEARLRDGRREIHWPNFELFSIRVESRPFDLIVGLGVEPHLRWKRYARAVVECVQRVDAQLVIMLGALLDEVIYSQPVQVMGYSSDPDVETRFGFQKSTYEGRTGILGVLGDALMREKLPAASLWARLPHYLASVSPYTRGTLALLQKLEELIDFPINKRDLESRAVEFDQNVSELISNDPELAAYVRELKRRAFSQ